ncbi:MULTISPECIES: hypothetical protein [unclassified Ruminococcus]|uniref:hypothetical protein n=1 Tax=unclassified Ruminococcus TaxID=2608920 RepID=UPI00210B1F0E|nr:MULTISPECIES: hypothetical protein [unclassified Ruminococcus]MCQ4021821.1 hypothetical protein [Ruminococcus sp. zg-924]MCQ4114266.1 hypothetical protein [Ruminococcus sp. zg-921]
MSNKAIRKISQQDEVLESKRTKRIRLAICVFYIITMVMCAFPYVQMKAPDGSIQFFTVFNMIFDGLRLADGTAGIVIYGIILFALPAVGFLFESFDKTRCFKCLTGILCPIAAVALICFGPGRMFSLGAMLSILFYIIITFMSVYLFLVVQEEKRQALQAKSDGKPQHNFKVEK